MRNWRTFLKAIYTVLRPLDPDVKLEYQPPVGDESSSVDVFMDENIDQQEAVDALKGIKKEWGCVTDADTNSPKASFRINVENDFKS